MPLCPMRSAPSISAGDNGGGSLSTVSRLSNGGRSSFCSSSHAIHSSQLFFPMFVPIKNCFTPFLVTPGRRDMRDGFLFCVSTLNPFLLHMSYSFCTRSWYSLRVFASMWTIACTDFPPEYTTAPQGSSMCLISASCFPSGILSDSTRAKR